MAFYHVQLPVAGTITTKNHIDSCLVQAESAAEAKLIAKSYHHLPSDAAWAAATVTALTEVTDLAGWRLRVEIDNALGVNVHDLTVTAVTVAVFNDLGDLMAAAGVTAGLTSTYATPNLEMSTIGDNIGNYTMRVTLLPPATYSDPTIAFPLGVGTITHEGAAGAVLNVVLLDVAPAQVRYNTTNR